MDDFVAQLQADTFDAGPDMLHLMKQFIDHLQVSYFPWQGGVVITGIG